MFMTIFIVHYSFPTILKEFSEVITSCWPLCFHSAVQLTPKRLSGVQVQLSVEARPSAAALHSPSLLLRKPLQPPNVWPVLYIKQKPQNVQHHVDLDGVRWDLEFPWGSYSHLNGHHGPWNNGTSSVWSVYREVFVWIIEVASLRTGDAVVRCPYSTLQL